jgi:hypothetical protein
MEDFEDACEFIEMVSTIDVSSGSKIKVALAEILVEILAPVVTVSGTSMDLWTACHSFLTDCLRRD